MDKIAYSGIYSTTSKSVIGEYGNVDGFSKSITEILNKLSVSSLSGGLKVKIKDDSYDLSYLKINGERIIVCGSKMTESDIKDYFKKIITFINKLDRDINILIQNGNVSSENEAYSRLLKSYITSRYENSKDKLLIKDINSDITDIKRKTKQSIMVLVQDGENLQELLVKSEKIKNESEKLQDNSHTLLKTTRCQYYIYYLIPFTIIAVMIWCLISYSICGNLWNPICSAKSSSQGH